MAKVAWGSRDEYNATVVETAAGEYVVAGNTSSFDGDVTGYHGPNPTGDYWIIKLGTQTGIGSTTPTPKFFVFPNPGHQVLSVESQFEIGVLRIYNSFGQLIREQASPIVNPIDMDGLSNGIYLVEMTTANATIVTKWVKM